MRYESREELISPQLEEVVGENTTSVILQGLRKYVQYEIRVLAYTRMGDGVLSSPEVVVRTDEDGRLTVMVAY